jgi:NAD(P)-dependent dehydrogenase (short-subunit alcohol dehydrogenase family)
MTDPRVAVITGGNRGLGRSAARSLAAAGYRIVVTHRPGGEATDTARLIEAAGGDVMTMPLDISDVPTFSAFVSDLERGLTSRWGASRLDVLVNNAGIGLFDPLAEVTPERFDLLVGTNFRGTFFLIQALVPLMGDGSRIVNISTSLTRHVSPGTSIYTAAKSAVEALTRTLAVELGPRGIRINTVAPGPTATDFNGGAMRDNPELRGYLATQTALGRVGRPEEIGDAIAALVSDQMRWVTAERLEVSGGALL